MAMHDLYVPFENMPFPEVRLLCRDSDLLRLEAVGGHREFVVARRSVITEFSFGKHFPEITQPLDNSFEITHDRMLFFLWM